jgi:hypothetical protein
LLAGEGQCEVPTSTNVGQTGAISSLGNAWNTRFGLYQGSYDSTANRMDKTGFAYTPTSWPVAAHDANGDGEPDNAYADFQSKHTSAVPYQGDAASGLKLVGSKTSSAAEYQAGSDRRIIATPVIYCPDWASPPPGTPSNQAPVRDWACMLLLAPIEGPDSVVMEFLGLAGDLGSPCATMGLPGGGVSGPLVPTLVR